MSFLNDLDKSRKAVLLLLDYFIDKGIVAYEANKGEQRRGDILIDGPPALGIEVKYDIMAARTKNLCFELSNGKRPTGIAATEADHVYYVVPHQQKVRIFVFDIQSLRSYLDKSTKVKIKKGGDGNRFDLGIVPIKDIVNDKVPLEDFILERN